MSIVLHRFPLSHFSEKGRALLDFKGLDYTIEEHTLGVPQVGIWRLSGQRKLPVIEHDGRVVSDSTRIAHYLDEVFPDRPRLVPREDPDRSEAIALEDRIDHVFGVGAPAVWYEHAVTQPDQVDLLAMEVWGLGVRGARALGAGTRVLRGLGVGDAFMVKWRRRTLELLADLSARLRRAPFLTGERPNFADVAASALPFHLEFPTSRHLAAPTLAGRGVPGVTDDPAFAPFFEWRRAFYEKYLR